MNNKNASKRMKDCKKNSSGDSPGPSLQKLYKITEKCIRMQEGFLQIVWSNAPNP